MARTSHVFRTFFKAKGIILTVEEHSAKDFADVQTLMGEKIMTFVAKGSSSWKDILLQIHKAGGRTITSDSDSE